MLSKKTQPPKLARYGDVLETDTMKHDSMGQRIRRLREAKRLSQGDLAKHCGVTRGAVSQWESDTTKNIKLQIFLKLLDALKVDFQYLIFGDAAGEDVTPVEVNTAQDEPSARRRRPRP